MAQEKLDWAMPVMRAGYTGRGITYVVIAAISLWTIWQGGQAQGTGDALRTVETSPFGTVLLVAIGVGLLCYTLWRVIDGFFDLEDEGDDIKGFVARVGMIVTGLVHAAIGIAALSIAFGSNGDQGGSQIANAVQAVMSVPFGIWLVGIAGIATIGAGIYYLHKAYTQSYMQKLHANHFTRNWNTALRAGVFAQGVVVTIIGVFLTYAAWTTDPAQAGGLGQTFDWLSQQLYGQVLVTALCLGLLGFAVFLFVNAAHRIVPRISDPDVTNLADAMS
ncbi:DUF1206 domain-containing protein [Yoonia litorea]|uniref:DUF1206 domain-containing protein n=1 Tax=Yoonia litorea TaxID=1123755 RepID=A0A1I6M1P2_9RHOB|nr:DUF1206 domain-containing protein [Yoonia litorea]SFS09554.1 protein of unknown function [Yoonia litorea]